MTVPQTTAATKIPGQLAWPPSTPGTNRLQAVINMLNSVWGQLAGKVNAAPTASGGVAPAILSLTASPFTYTNSDGWDEDVLVSGGTVSSLVLIRSGVGTTLGAVAGTIHLAPLDALKITYSSTPGAIKLPW